MQRKMLTVSFFHLIGFIPQLGQVNCALYVVLWHTVNAFEITWLDGRSWKGGGGGGGGGLQIVEKDAIADRGCDSNLSQSRYTYYYTRLISSKHEPLNQCWFDVGSASQTFIRCLACLLGYSQHKTSIQCRINVGPASTTLTQH